MQSFSQAMRTKMLRALTHALTGGHVSIQNLSLSSLARVLCVFPIHVLIDNNGETLLHFLKWSKTTTADDSTFCFSTALATAFQYYLAKKVEGSTSGVLSFAQLARLLLLTTEVGSDNSTTHCHDDREPIETILLRSPRSLLLSEAPNEDVERTHLVLLVAKFEKQIQELLDSSALASASKPGFAFSFHRDSFYDENVNCSYLLNSSYDNSPTLAGQWELQEMTALDALCEELKTILSTGADNTVFNLALAAKCLSAIGANFAALGSLKSFESELIVPLLLHLDTARRYSRKLDARCATYDACVEALPTAGMDPSGLIQMANVLSLTLSQLASPLASGSGDISRLLEEVWSANNDSKAKLDALTRAVVTCIFQPLLLYKKPLIDEKEQLTTDGNAPFQGFQGFSPLSDSQSTAIASHAKDRFVRLVVLTFLDDVAVDGSATNSETQHLMNALLAQLVALYVTPEWQKQHMLNSDGLGKKLRSWQALCIVSAITSHS
ncbi:unnamed protein product [Phytophthora lilii]|uniref:Unnamed protein product n=1 Tax=Phytophthora lilii TaxID=2077276 RepID=A0A9W6U637_9STRA|nr:unnamed protein product [Phytophthora lilii]